MNKKPLSFSFLLIRANVTEAHTFVILLDRTALVIVLHVVNLRINQDSQFKLHYAHHDIETSIVMNAFSQSEYLKGLLERVLDVPRTSDLSDLLAASSHARVNEKQLSR